MKYFLIVILFIGLRAEAKVIEVTSKSSIADALSRSGDGDTIFIRKGTYKVNNVLVNKRITIIGEDYPMLDGSGKYQIFYLNGDGIKISKIHFINSGYSSVTDIAAVKIINSRNFVL